MRDDGEKYSDYECILKESQQDLGTNSMRIVTKRENPRLFHVFGQSNWKDEMSFTEMGNLWEDHLGT